MWKLACRLYQKAMFLAGCVLPWHEPEIYQGEGAEARLIQRLHAEGIRSLLFVTGPNIYRRGLPKPLIQTLGAAGIQVSLFSDTQANPPIEQVESCLAQYRRDNCTAVLAFGGGSPMDLGKVTAARVACPRKSVQKMRGLLKIRRRLPFLIAVPTTSGSGSECTLAAVISDHKTQRKFAINDTALIPRACLLNPAYVASLPPKVTAETGMDALTHAVEAYIGRSNTAYTREKAEHAIRRILQSLERAYADGGDLAARSEMQLAAYEAGCAFTRAYVGYVHALSHAVSALYNSPHGLTNAIILPAVLDAYGPAADKALARLARQNALTASDTSDAEAARAMRETIRAMNARMAIPKQLPDLREADIDALVDRAIQEANPLYPVPRILGRSELAAIYRKLLPRSSR